MVVRDRVICRPFLEARSQGNNGETTLLVVNPKRKNELIEVKPYWYNYYAGYSHTFTQKIIESAGLPKSAVILDPWNGSGTTTLMASFNDFCSVGIDLNPVMKVIASAKQAVNEDIYTISNVLNNLSARRKPKIVDADNLSAWFDPSTVRLIRSIEHDILGGEEHKSTIEKVDSLTTAQCLMYTGLFNCIRNSLSEYIPSNPTWVKRPPEGGKKVGISWDKLKKQFIGHVQDMVNGISVVDHQWPREIASIKVASSMCLPIESASIDFVLTSPPYCTRIDYGVATLPELSVICCGGWQEIDSIRRQLMGTTTVPRHIEGDAVPLPKSCRDFLEAVESHSSKASKTYYYKNFYQYFISLNASIQEIERVMKPGAEFVCVAQDSFYKDVHCDLPRVISEMAVSRGLKIKDSIQFESKQTMANLNVKSKLYTKTKKALFENVLIFCKGQ